jgi:amino acid transporter
VGGRLRRELGLFALAAVVFFNVSGGPYGIEDMVPSFGPGVTLLLLVLVPLLWSLPVALVLAELSTAIPDGGGYITWTTRAFGPFWGFQVGWWSWLDSFVDVAVYPALFVEYARFWHPQMTVLERWLLAVAFIVVLTVLNVVGVRPVGRAAVALGVASLAPVAALVLVGARAVGGASWTPLVPPGGSLVGGLGLGLAVVMWNYSGWDTPATVLDETRAPERVFRHALWLALPLVTAAYVLPMAVALGAGAVPWSAWTTATLPAVAAHVGGPWLGHAVAAGAAVATAGLFLSLLFTNSRIPYVLARDRHLPDALGAVSARFGTPVPAVLSSAVVYAACAAFSFRDLVVLDVWLYSLTLVIELAAFVRLRVCEPALRRPWRVPGGLRTAALVAALPAAFALLAMATAGWRNTVAGVVAALTGPLVYARFSSMTRARQSRVGSEYT